MLADLLPELLRERHEGTRIFLAKKLRVEMLLASISAQRKCAFAEVAKRLAVHRNTLQYRLKKIKEITGLDPWNFRDAFERWAAVFLRDENGRNIP